MEIKKLAAALALAGGLTLAAGQAQAVFIIDDFGPLAPPQGPDPDTGVSYSYQALDTNADGAAVTVSAPAKFTNTVWGSVGGGAGISRDISADLSVQGDGLAAEICYNCQAGEHNADSASDGDTAFIYQGPSTDASGYSQVMLQYSSDLDGMVITFTFDDINGAEASVSTAALPNTGGAIPANYQPISLALPGGIDWSQLTSARIDIDGVLNLDAQIDDFKLVPEPGALALMGLGLAGLAGWRRRATG